MLDDLARKARAGTAVQWDDLRQQRILNRTLGRLAEPAPVAASTSVGHPARPRRWGLVAGASLAAAAAVVIATVVTGLGSDPVSEPQALAPVEATEPSNATMPAHAAGVEQSVLRLRDGSLVTLSPGAEVAVLGESSDDVSLRQTTGYVTYSIPDVAGRRVRVEASTIVLIIVTAAFTVQVQDEAVTIAVASGVVEITTADRKMQLGEGERATLKGRAGGLDLDEAETDSRPEPDAKTGPRGRRVQPTADELMRISDEARRARRVGPAADALRQMARLYPDDPRVPTALFTLGRVERDRGRHEAAAKAFDRCYRAQRGGPLASDALAGAASAWMMAAHAERARNAANRYLERFPDGLHAETMHEILR